MKSRLLSMLLTGFALALGLLIAVQVSQSLTKDTQGSAPSDTVTQEDLNQTVQPVLFKTISEQNGELRLSGTSEPDAVIVVQNKAESFRQIRANDTGHWATSFRVDGNETLALGLLVYVSQGAKIQSEEVLYRIPALPIMTDLGIEHQPALIMVTAPGGPSRVIQSPFRGAPTAGALSMGPIDYDERGSVIFSGTSEAAGNVRIYANGVLVGQSLVAVNGRWFFIAGETLPLGSYDISAELTESDGRISTVSVPFNRLKGIELNASNGERITVSYEANRWQVGRDLYGGGRQYTAVFAPQTAETIEPQN